MELVQVKGNTWCLEGKELIPVYRIDRRRCILLDGGWYWEWEELVEALEREDLLPVAAIGSHAHIDHVGNYGRLKEKYGTFIALSEGEAALTSQESREQQNLPPHYEVIGFTADQIFGREDGPVYVLGVGFNIYHTPGHSPDHLCIGTSDGVCYLGDLMMAGEELDKVEMPYHDAYFKARLSIEKMRAVKGYTCYIAAHRGIIYNFDDVAEKNIEILERIEKEVLDVLKMPLAWDDLVRDAIKATHVTVKNRFQELAYREFISMIVGGLIEEEKVEVQTVVGKRKYCRRG